jgi:hypothetical protein
MDAFPRFIEELDLCASRLMRHPIDGRNCNFLLIECHLRNDLQISALLPAAFAARPHGRRTDSPPPL